MPYFSLWTNDMKSVKILLIASLALLAACDPTPAEWEAANDATERNARSPELVMTLPDGRPVHRIRIVIPQQHDHFIYVVDGGSSTSLNQTVPNGKTTYQQVNVTIPANASATEVIELAEKLKAEQLAADEAEFERLKKQLGR